MAEELENLLKEGWKEVTELKGWLPESFVLYEKSRKRVLFYTKRDTIIWRYEMPEDKTNQNPDTNPNSN
jgi:hypothetical protein